MLERARACRGAEGVEGEKQLLPRRPIATATQPLQPQPARRLAVRSRALRGTRRALSLAGAWAAGGMRAPRGGGDGKIGGSNLCGVTR